MQKNKVKSHKPEYKVAIKKKNKSKEDIVFLNMINRHNQIFYNRELLIDQQIEKMIYGN
jgi:FtsZ-interacting cell division protein ZipA